MNRPNDASTSLPTITHGYYQPYFYWMFPILVAKEEGLFESAGVRLEMHDIVRGGQPEDKANWYKEALDDKSRDFYFCCVWQGVYSTCETGRGRIGAALKSTQVKSFAVYTRPQAGTDSILDIIERGSPIAVNKNADAHYVTLKNLAEFVPESQIKFSHLGGIEKCFTALLHGDVDAATLAGPYADAAEALGFRRLLPLSRTEPTVIVFNDAVEKSTASSFLEGINDAIVLINTERAKYKRRYVQEFESVVREHIPELVESLPRMKQRLTLPVWTPASILSEDEYTKIHSFLLTYGLSVQGGGYEDLVDSSLVAEVSG